MRFSELNLKCASRRTTTTIILVYLIYLFTFTFTPFEFSLDTSPSLSRMYYGALEDFSTNTIYFVWDLITNILLFIPFGFLFFALLKASEERRAIKIILTAFSGFILSFMIEFCQFFFPPRDPSLADVFSNTIGAITGALVATSYYAQLTRLAQRCWSSIQKRSKSISTITIIYGALLFTFFNFPILHSAFSNNFSNWDPSFTFQLGNEATLDRPWLGKIYLVAIYKRALDPKEVFTNFKAGPFHDASKTSAQDDLVAFYNFNEGARDTIHDTSSFDSPLDLTIHDTSKIEWLTPNGIELLENTVIKSQKPYNKLFYYLYSTNSLTVEVWIAPTNVTQGGPARIVSLSRDPFFRNFTLGQNGKNIQFRLRTPITGLNGLNIRFETKDNPLTTEIQHLVVTYKNGIEKLYVNGIDYKTTFLDTLLDKSDKLLNPVGAGLGEKWAYCLLFFFPVGFLSYTTLSRNSDSDIKPILFSVIMGSSPLVVIEIFQVLEVPRPFDLSLLSVGLVVVLISVLMSYIINKSVYSA